MSERIISRQHVVFSFNAVHPCRHVVENGETFWVEAEDAYRGQINSPAVKRTDIDTASINCSTGPIRVAGARPGDTLCVEFRDFAFEEQGVMVTSVGLGLLGDKITEPDSKIIPLRGGRAFFSEEISLPLTPMVGVCGVAPKPGLDFSCAWPGDHGGNLDTTLLRAGARLYLPVEVEGANLCIGDLHACMGDGEISGTAVETPGSVQVRVSLRRDRSTRRPVVVTEEGIYFLASAPTLDAAVRMAVEDAVDYLAEKLDLAFPDAYRLCSAACHTQISQVVNPLKTARVRCPRFHPRVGEW